uniref:Uncharacterized protein n=1 Tax=Graphocephala atropunctata TaxID=36148 RepID=A0A1B6KMP7_9HEMI
MIFNCLFIILMCCYACKSVEGLETDVSVNKTDSQNIKEESPEGTFNEILKPYVPTSRDLIRDQEALLAALIDRQHLSWFKFLKEQNVTLDHETTKSVITDKMMLMTLKVLPDLAKLAKMTDNKQESAKRVCTHYDEDHLYPHATTLAGLKSKKVLAPMVKTIHQLICGLIKIILINYS